MDRLGSGFLRRIDDAIDAQVALSRWRGADRHGLIGVQDVKRGAIGLGVNRDRGIAELTASANDTHRDLAAIRNEHFHGASLYWIKMRRMPSEAINEQRHQILSGVVDTLLRDLKEGNGDKDRRRQVEEWMRTLAEKYPEFKIEVGLRDYYLAEANRLRSDFEKAGDLTEKLVLGRNIESFLDRAADYDRRIEDK
jgi:hypothetical protein